jgi:hypothetical protein
MSEDQGDAYAAFDFFVTAEHMVDWYLPNDKPAQHELRASEVLLQITSHLANGAKHFKVKDKRHKSVRAVSNEAYADSDYTESGYFANEIEITLSEAESSALSSEKIDALALAYRVYEYWRTQLNQ